MSLTLGAAERAREQLQELLLRQREPIIRLGLLTGFLLKTRTQLTPSDQWPLFVRPLLSHLVSLSTPSLFAQLLPNALSALDEVIVQAPAEELEKVIRDIRHAMLAQALYVGDWERSCALLGISASIPTDIPDPIALAETLLSTCASGGDREFLEQHIRRWKELVTQRSATEIQVLMVTPEQADWSAHGVLTALELVHPAGAEIPHLRFDHTGEQVDAAVLALDAARNAAGRWLSRELRLPAPSGATLRLKEVQGTIEGPSLALAIAGLCVSDVTKRALARRQFRFLGNVAMTGALDAEGHVQPVRGITEKITRAFHSHVDYVAVPANQELEAQRVVDELSAQHPRRMLSIVPVRHLDDLFSQRRLVADYLVPLPLHVIHRVGLMPSWARALLAVIAFVILIVTPVLHYYPALRPWISRTPVFWNATNGSDLVIKNKDGIILWTFDPGESWDCRSSTIWLTNETFTKVELDSIRRDLYSLSANRDYNPTCYLADVNGDRKPEVLFLHTRAGKREANVPFNTLYCLSSSGKVLWKRVFEQRDISPLAPDDHMPTEVIAWIPIDWRGTHGAKIVIAQADASPSGRPLAFLEELDGRTGETLHCFWHRQWFWCLLVVPDSIGPSNNLWAGTFNTLGHPELFIISDSIRSRVWPCEDTTGFIAARWPIADIFLAHGKAAWLWHLENQGKASVNLCFTNTEIRISQGGEWSGYSFFVDHRLQSTGVEMSNFQWGLIQEFARDRKFRLPESKQAWIEPLTYGEAWTGKTWVPVDTTRPPPDPYPIYSFEDPRLH